MTTVQFPRDLLDKFVALPLCVCCGEPSTKFRTESLYRPEGNEEFRFPYFDRCHDHDLIDAKSATWGCAGALLVALFVGAPLAGDEGFHFIGHVIVLGSLVAGVYLVYEAIRQAAGAKARLLGPNCKATAYDPAVKVKSVMDRPFDIEFANDAIGHMWALLVLLWFVRGLDPLHELSRVSPRRLNWANSVRSSRI
ncbi:MAG: hypothetical protein HUU17_06925 [Chthonomonadales bacterium]|nr:hypothetical protein [Chthonomonadales bacterium]